ncbi:hypothetical protein LSCM1_01757 [Leishmania martiniquensis]|uniref:Uncharacterized protein n=1 Tax=Leishmania martiniquensis TaxID=1580590 RepID=A0A836KLW4_9TRYP|nr:hypothetical protein LSCM1_01757 [Leishmania martiniquensis]
MPEEKKPRFLQQTTSQLLHQQEALRKRREMLERESAKPPVMRFGTSTPPRNAGRHGRSPVPPSSTSERQAAHSALPQVSGVHRELNWSRSEDEKAVERAPMRFSTLFRPSPAASVLTHARVASAHYSPSSPSPREVNTSDQVDALLTKRRKETSSPRTVSPRSPVLQRSRMERDCIPSEKTKRRMDSPALVFAANPDKAAQTTAGEASQAGASQTSARNVTPPQAAVELRTSASRPDPQEALTDEQDEATGIAAFSNTFPVPRFTPLSPVPASATKRPQQTDDEVQSTPIRFAIGEFRTPRPLTRHSNAVTPVAGQSFPVQRDDADPQAPPAVERKIETRPTASPTPEPAPRVRASAGPATGAEECAPPIPPEREAHLSIAHGTASTEVADTHDTVQTTEPREAILHSSPFANVSPRRKTPSPPRRTKVSPAPTPQDLIHSVQVSAEKRPCGCERPTPSPGNWNLRRNTATPSRTGSPPPTPVPPSNRPMTDFGAPLQKCCDRPTPVSLSSQPAGGEIRNTTAGASSASPWPTTENIICSIMAATSEGLRRGREVCEAATVHSFSEEADRGALEQFSNGEGNASHTNSSNRAMPETFDMHANVEDKECVGGHDFHAAPHAYDAAHTPSPVPSDRQYGESLLASAEKRRCGRPTPPERNLDVAVGGDPDSHASYTTSGSPQPSASHLLRSLDVSIEKGSPRGKPADRAEQVRGSGTGEASAREAAGQLTAFRTPSPTPTPEHVIASLQASAEKRGRSGAVDATTAPTDSLAAAPTSTSCSSYQSPTLTPQNVKDSVQKLVREPQQVTRCDAPAPMRPWKEMSKGTPNSASCGATWNSSASPVVTAENVDVTLDTLERDQRYQSRSSHASRASGVSPEEPSDLLPHDSALSSLGAAEKADGVDACETRAPVTEEAAPPAVASPAPSEIAATSTMFFDCVSAPSTPALQSAETAKKDEDTLESAIHRRGAAHVPQHFYDLQREVAEISKGRSRTRTLLPHAYERLSPIPTQTMPVAGDTPPAVAPIEQEQVAYHAPLHEADDPRDGGHAASEKDAETEDLARRSSLILVYPSASPQPLLQQPHKPAPAVPAPSVSPVQVPRTPTPPPRCPLQQARSLAIERRPVNSIRSDHHESPLPRPVPLRSQVALGQAVQMSHKSSHSGTVPPVWGAPCVLAAKCGVACAPPHRACMQPPPSRCTAALPREEAVDQEANLFDPQNDWMDLVQPLQPHTITVSPQGGTVVYTEHSSTESPGNLEGPVRCASPSRSRKRSRSAQTPLPQTRQLTAATPASIALTLDDGVSSGRKSSRNAATPKSQAPQTPRSSARGRKSQAEELLEMLPAEVMAEVVRIEEAEGFTAACTAAAAVPVDSLDCRPSLGSCDGRLSGVSDGDSTLGLASTISQRVSQRPRRVYHNYDYYIQYLQGIANSSAKKARKAAGRRTHRAVLKDVASVNAKPIVQHAGGGRPSAASPLPCGSRSRSGSSRGIGSPATSTKSSAMRVPEDTAVSPEMSSPRRAGGRRQLTVSTRLSAELQKALFKEPLPAKTTRKRSLRKASAKSTKPAKKSSTPSPKGRGSVSSTTTPKVAKAPPSDTRGKRSIKKFVTAKAMRLPRRSAKRGKA